MVSSGRKMIYKCNLCCKDITITTKFKIGFHEKKKCKLSMICHLSFV